MDAGCDAACPSRPGFRRGAVSSPRRRHRRAVYRRSRAALREPRLRRQHAGDGRGVGCRGGVRPLVQQRPPRQRREVAGLHQRVRGRPRRRRRASSAHGRATRWSSSATPRRRSTSSPPRCRAGTRVLSSGGRAPRQHAPWRRHDLRLLPFTALARRPDRGVRARAPARARGSTWSPSPAPPTSPARCGRSPSSPRSRTTHGAKLFVDAAQLAPHRAIDMAGTGIDYLALSGHKLYAPFGAGALVGAPAAERGDPLLHGGGAIKLVSLDDVIWAEAPERHEAGSPNVDRRRRPRRRLPRAARDRHGRARRRERALAAGCGAAWPRSPACSCTLWRPGATDRVGVATFTLDGYRHPLLAAILSAEHAIGVRHGCFCAHPLIARLLDVSRRARSPAAASCAPAAAAAARRRAREPGARHHAGGHRPAARRAAGDRRTRPAVALCVRARPGRVSPRAHSVSMSFRGSGTGRIAKAVREGLTYANVMATTAVFIAIGGRPGPFRPTASAPSTSGTTR